MQINNTISFFSFFFVFGNQCVILFKLWQKIHVIVWNTWMLQYRYSEICTVMNGVNVDFCMRMEVLMALQQMWGWLISTWMFVFSSCLIYLIAISIKLCRKRQKNERKQVEERRRGVCAEVRFYTLLFVLLFLFLVVQNVRDVSALTLENICHTFQCFWVTCWAAL